jgi:hypothetical protein
LLAFVPELNVRGLDASDIYPRRNVVQLSRAAATCGWTVSGRAANELIRDA